MNVFLFLIILHVITIIPKPWMVIVDVGEGYDPLVTLIQSVRFPIDPGFSQTKNNNQNISNTILKISFSPLFSRKNEQIGSDFSFIFRLIETSKNAFPKIEVSVNSWKRGFLQVRSMLSQVIIGHLNEPAAGLVLSMVFGKSDSFSTSLEHSFRVIGMQHVVAASGYNVGLVLTLAQFVFSRFRRFYRFVCLVVVVLLYVSLTDTGAPLIRAVIMAILSLMCRGWWYRQYHPLWSLSLVSFLMIGVNPEYLTSVSFQLSVAATAGICLILPRLATWSGHLSAALVGDSSRLVQPRSDSSQNSLLSVFFTWMGEAFATTCAAQALTVPLVLFHFQEISLLSWPANTFLLWFTPLITTGGVLVMLGGGLVSLVPGLASLTSLGSFPLQLLTDIFIAATTWLGHFESTLIKLDFFTWKLVYIWWAVVGLGVWVCRPSKASLAWTFYASQV